MLQKGFFLTDSYNRAPYWNGTVLVDLHGAAAFEEDTRFFPGHYRIELAPGRIALPTSGMLSGATVALRTVTMSYDETLYDYFKVRAYCGANSEDGGLNPYSGPFKVDMASNVSSSTPGIDVNHIFGAGGGNSHEKFKYTGPDGSHTSVVTRLGGPNCLGGGIVGGSCLHLMPLDGVFGTDYFRAYHAAPTMPAYYGHGSAYGGAKAGAYNTGSGYSGQWFTRGGDSPYGTGGRTIGEVGTGIGAAKTNAGGAAYFNGSEWVDVPSTVKVIDATTSPWTRGPGSYIKITYLGPLVPGQY